MDRENQVSKYSLATFHRLISLLVIFFVNQPSSHAALANGEFVADKPSPMFQSKNKQTNPDKLLSTVGQNYHVVEILGDDTAPEWLRIHTSVSISPLRWIQGNCGQYTTAKDLQSAADVVPTSTNNTASAPQTKTQGNLCQIAGNFDSHILALSWQNTFCELYGKRKAECRALTETRDSPNSNTLACTDFGLIDSNAA